MLFSPSVERGWLERDQGGQCWLLTLLTGACVELGLGIGPAAQLGTEVLTGLQEPGTDSGELLLCPASS